MSNVGDWEVWTRDENGHWTSSDEGVFLERLYDSGALDEVLAAWDAAEADESSPVTPEVADERLAKWADEDEAARWGVKLTESQRELLRRLIRAADEEGDYVTRPDEYDPEYVSRRRDVNSGFGGKSECGGEE